MAASEQTRTSPHEWASPEYIRFWADRTDREEDVRRYRFDLMADLVPDPKGAPISILDIGAGYGALSAVLLERFPAARATCLDGSPAMLALLEERQGPFKGRITRVLADYSQSEWTNALPKAQFDVVVSSQALHGQRERRRTLYAEIYRVVKPEGCFLSADLVPATSESLGLRFRDVEIRRKIRRQEQATRRRPTYDEVAAEIDRLSPGARPADHTRWRNAGDWIDDLRWLREAGFVDVDCFWKDLRIALIGGYKREAGEP